MLHLSLIVNLAPQARLRAQVPCKRLCHLCDRSLSNFLSGAKISQKQNAVNTPRSSIKSHQAPKATNLTVGRVLSLRASRKNAPSNRTGKSSQVRVKAMTNAGIVLLRRTHLAAGLEYFDENLKDADELVSSQRFMFAMTIS